MAFVYRGWDTTEHRSVAFKVLRREYATVLGPTRFLREIRLLSQLHHPGILPLLDSGHSDSLFYFTMPLVEGETLQARLEREPQLPLGTVQRIVSQVAAALDYAHDSGIVHRDIKPSNLFLSTERTVVADFGIAKDLTPRDDESTTSTGLVVGTVQYMSPEQAGGSAEPDGRTDIYALGCVAYQMLVGEPPFNGPSAQAVMARHRSLPAPSIQIFRPELPAGVDAVIRKALAKSPADRFQRAGEFAAALTDPEQLRSAAQEAEEREHPRRRRRWLAPVASGLVLLTAALLFVPRGRALDADKVVVFPLGETPPQATQEGAGAVVALMIGTALEYTEPLEWIDGLPRLDERQRRDIGQLTAAEASRIAREAGARWYLDGTVVRRGDSATVVLRLNDAKGDSVVGRASATRVAVEAPQAGLAAVNQLLPRLLAPGQRMADLSALAARRPAAVAMWLQGEQEYRNFNFSRALDFEQRAVKEDSSLAVAAIRGAQAASWLNDMTIAGSMSDIAIRNISLLPGRMAPFARGLHAYHSGQADSAVVWLTEALASSPQWTEAHMALGEVYFHLLPSVPTRLDSLAEIEFTAAAADSGFSPARYHLAQLAIRSGDTTRARLAVEDFARLAQSDASSAQQAELLFMFGCVREGRKGVDWKKAAAIDPVDVLRAAVMLAGAGAFPGCAEDGFHALFDNPASSLQERWGAFLGLQGILAAEGRTSELRALVDSAMASGLDLADQLYVLDALAGVRVAPEAETVVARVAKAGGMAAPSTVVWLAGEWRAQAGELAATGVIRDTLLVRAARLQNLLIARFAGVLGARIALLQGDTAAAITRLRATLGAGRREEVDWALGESLAPDRLLLAELLLARGAPREAIATATIFDHPAPITFLPYLPASLVLRRRAALALGREGEARRYEERLAALGDGPRLAGALSTLTPEAR